MHANCTGQKIVRFEHKGQMRPAADATGSKATSGNPGTGVMGGRLRREPGTSVLGARARMDSAFSTGLAPPFLRREPRLGRNASPPRAKNLPLRLQIITSPWRTIGKERGEPWRSV